MGENAGDRAARKVLTRTTSSIAPDSIKSGKIVVLLNGRFAGRKAVVVDAAEQGSDDRKYSHALGTFDVPSP